MEYVEFIDILYWQKSRNFFTEIDVTFDPEGIGRPDFWSTEVQSFLNQNAGRGHQEV